MNTQKQPQEHGSVLLHSRASRGPRYTLQAVEEAEGATWVLWIDCDAFFSAPEVAR